jgi:hypothetical protein
MNLTIQELNEIYYSLGVSLYKGMFANEAVHASATEKILAELKRVNDLPKPSQPKSEIAKEIAELKKEVKVIEPITDTGSEVADFLIAATAQLPEPSVETEEPTVEVEEPVKKAKFPGAKKSNLMDPEK